MPSDTRAVLRTALQRLEAERERLDQYIRAVRAALGSDGPKALGGRPRRRRRGGMTATAPKRVRKRKAYLANRRSKSRKSGRRAARSRTSRGGERTRARAARTAEGKR